MTTTDPLHARRTSPSGRRALRDELRRFARVAFVFCLGIALAAEVLDVVVCLLPGAHAIGYEIYETKRRAAQPGSRVTSLVLGDSVARQFFRAGHEPTDDVRFLTSNQAISLAGQYFLLQDALKHCPNVRDIYLVYYPGSFENDLGPQYTNDYFCGYFHRPRQMREVFAVKRDLSLLAAQIGRFLLPNLLALNARWHVAGAEPVGPPGTLGGTSGAATGAYQHPPIQREPLLDAASDLLGRPPLAHQLPDPSGPPGARLVVVSTVSRHFLSKIKSMCQSRGIAFHVLPPPCSDERHFRDREGVYDMPIWYIDPKLFRDTIHIRKPLIGSVRRKVVEQYHLDSANFLGLE